MLWTDIKSQQKVLSACADCRENIDTMEYQKIDMKSLTAACGSPYLSSGYPPWTNYWAGWMVRIINNNTTCSVVINSFEARFGGTSGYRIYTKPGTFVGFETNPSAWTLVGTLSSLTGTSTTAPTAIPIAVNTTIPPGGDQSFYLTRTDNLTSNRHLYVTGSGVAGITIYASNADLSITEAYYINTYFVYSGTPRRPSFDVCYTLNCPLPVELISFEAKNYNNFNQIRWITQSEINLEYFSIERSADGTNWIEIEKFKAKGNPNKPTLYEFNDYHFNNGYNFYRLAQVDKNGNITYSKIVEVDNRIDKDIKLLKTFNLLGKEVDQNYKGLVIEYYNNGDIRKVIRN